MHDANAANSETQLSKLVMSSKHSMVIGTSSDLSPQILFWSLANGRLEHEIELGKKKWAYSITNSPDGEYLAVTFMLSNEIGFYSISQKKWLWKRPLEEKVVGTSVQFAADGTDIIVLGLDYLVTYNSRTGHIIKREQSPAGMKKEFACLSSTGRYFAVWGPRVGRNDDFLGPLDYVKPKWITVRDTGNMTAVLETSKLLKPYKYCGGTFAPDDHSLVLGSLNGEVSIWSLQQGKVIREWQAYGKGAPLFQNAATGATVSSLTISRDGKFLASYGIDLDVDNRDSLFRVKIWDFISSSLLKTFEISNRGASCNHPFPMVFSADGKLFAIEQENLCLYDTTTWAVKWCAERKPDGTYSKDQH